MMPDKYLHTTPGDREILTHYYCGPSPHPRPSEYATEVCEHFVSLGLFEKLSEPNEYGSIYRANHEALRPYMEALGNIPLPVKVTRWEVPE